MGGDEQMMSWEHGFPLVTLVPHNNPHHTLTVVPTVTTLLAFILLL